MLYFPVDFGELTIDGLVDTGVLSSAITEVDLNRNRLLDKKAIIEEIRHLIFAGGTIKFKEEPERVRIELIGGEETPGLCSDSSMATSADLPF